MIKWEKVEHGWTSGQFTIVERYPGQWTATDWSTIWSTRELSPTFPSDEEAKAWCENRLPSEPPLPDGL